jgi:hypothetical protein
MKVRELIETNPMITDLQLTIRHKGILIDQIHIGPDAGEKPRYPTRIPLKKEFRGVDQSNDGMYRDAEYIPESINVWDDGKDYWQVKAKMIPREYREMEVRTWEVWPASTVTNHSPRRSRTHFYGQRINIEIETKEETTPKVEPKPEPKKEMDGQMSLWDLGKEDAES